jgi:hypothetical protein
MPRQGAGRLRRHVRGVRNGAARRSTRAPDLPAVRLESRRAQRMAGSPAVRAGTISKLGEVYVYQGRPFPAVSLIDAALHRLATAGMVTRTEPDRAVVSLTKAGQARYTTLDQHQRAHADLP